MEGHALTPTTWRSLGRSSLGTSSATKADDLGITGSSVNLLHTYGSPCKDRSSVLYGSGRRFGLRCELGDRCWSVVGNSQLSGDVSLANFKFTLFLMKMKQSYFFIFPPSKLHPPSSAS
jgi:hypothetical protein